MQAPKKDKAPPPSSKPTKSGGGKQKKKVRDYDGTRVFGSFFNRGLVIE